jgi:hypothetical protein
MSLFIISIRYTFLTLSVSLGVIFSGTVLFFHGIFGQLEFSLHVHLCMLLNYMASMVSLVKCESWTCGKILLTAFQAPNEDITESQSFIPCTGIIFVLSNEGEGRAALFCLLKSLKRRACSQYSLVWLYYQPVGNFPNATCYFTFNIY